MVLRRLSWKFYYVFCLISFQFYYSCVFNARFSLITHGHTVNFMCFLVYAWQGCFFAINWGTIYEKLYWKLIIDAIVGPVYFILLGWVYLCGSFVLVNRIDREFPKSHQIPQSEVIFCQGSKTLSGEQFSYEHLFENYMIHVQSHI